jgi:hydroxypyruvate isomerase
MVFTDLELTDRIRRIGELGFDVEIWNWNTKDIDALKATGATFSSMTGYVSGSLTHDQDQLLKTASQSIEVAKQLGCPRLNLHGTELGDHGLPRVPQYELTGEMWLAAEKTLTELARLGAGGRSPEPADDAGRLPRADRRGEPDQPDREGRAVHR